MNVRTQKNLLNLASAVVVALAIGLGVWTYLSPVAGPASISFEQTGEQSPGSPTTNPSGIDLGLASWNVALTGVSDSGFATPEPEVQRPQPPPPKPRPPRRLDFELLGVVVEDGKSQAIVIDADRRIDVRSQGETLELIPEGATITQIGETSVVISLDGDEYSIELEL